jgi:hypothetical protein
VDDGIGHEGRRKEYKKKASTPQWKKMRQSVDLESCVFPQSVSQLINHLQSWPFTLKNLLGFRLAFF